MSNPAVKLATIVTLEEAQSQLTATPDVRRELVEKFRFLIETGRYQVSAEAVAAAMIEDGVFEN